MILETRRDVNSWLELGMNRGAHRGRGLHTDLLQPSRAEGRDGDAPGELHLLRRDARGVKEMIKK